MSAAFSTAAYDMWYRSGSDATWGWDLSGSGWRGMPLLIPHVFPSSFSCRLVIVITIHEQREHHDTCS